MSIQRKSLRANHEEQSYIIPKTYDPHEHEAKWQSEWNRTKVYKFDWEDTARPWYSIDTPPPYPTGELHMGHVLNWCYFDFIARYKRMRGYNVHFPQGWDCHGLPTEVKVETLYGIRRKDLPPEKFRELCMKVTEENIERMKRTMMSMGFSMDWSLEYRTMDPSYIRLSQLAFVILYNRGYLYRGEHPVNWCPRCETAIAEAEVEYVQKDGLLVYVRFETTMGDVIVATSRPELLPACVAIAVHPADKRYQRYVGDKARVPLIGREVPILQDLEVDPDFGTGVVMVCTFGDKTDVKWQKKYRLPVINVISEDGCMTDEAAKYRGLTINECREAILRDLQDHKLILKIEPITQNVGTCWRCQTPIEIISKRQWFMKTREMTEAVIEWSSKVNWIPAFARKRMIDWASSLDWDWVISRQRVFGTPIPVWYCVDCGTTLVAREDELPVDPKLQKPSSSVCQRCGSMSFVAETDVMDTWMDSSITCAVHGGWPDKPEFLERLFPADLQQNGLDIIRTWDYYLMVKHLALLGKAPYKTVLINGMVRGTDGRMMHRHLGNYVEASEAIKKYGADAVRQWAASGGSTGSDIPFRWEDVEYGRRFLTKLWNASRFIISNLYDFKRDSKPALEVIDKWIIARLEATIRAITDAFENFQFNTALENLRRFAWHDLCDNYLEAVKYRLYQTSSNYAESRQAAQFTLFHVLDKLIRLLAPFCPHITESINRALWKDEPAYTSIHRSKWPVPEFLIDASTENEGELLIKLISEIRRMKAENHVSLKSPIKVVTIYTNAQQYDIILRNTEVLKRTLKIENFIVDTSPAPPESKKLESIPSARVIIEFG